MKKTIILAALIGVVSFTSCGKKGGEKKEDNPKDSSSNTNTEEQKQPTGVLSGTLTLAQTAVEPGEEIRLSFTAAGSEGNNPWVGIIPASTPHGNADKNDEYDIAYKYLDGKTEGELVFIAPPDTGSFDFRMNSSGKDKKEVASVSFRIKGPANTKIEIGTDKKSYAKGEKMIVTFRALVTWNENAWIGLVPAATKHGSADVADEVDMGYKYLEKRSKGSFEFTAPNEAGKYSFRMFDAENGKEVKSVDFVVE